MHDIVVSQLRPVRRRQTWQGVLGGAVLGLLAGAAAGVALGAGRWLAGWSVAWGPAAALMAAGPLLGALAGWARRRGWPEAAEAVDACYQLKDRVVSALEFVASPRQTRLEVLQIQDAVHFLDDVEPARVVPWRLPRAWPASVLTLGLAVALLAWPAASPPAQAQPAEPLPEIVAEAEHLADDLRAIEDLVRQEANPELRKFVQDLRRKTEELKQPGVDLREALAKLSEMQAAIAAQQAQSGTATVDEQLRAFAAALAAAPALEGLAKALQEGKLDRAAAELEKMDEAALDRQEARAVAKKLEEAARGMQAKGLEGMSEAARQMAEGVKGDKGRLRQGARDLARRLREHERRRRLQQLLALEMDRLKECKSRCSSAMLAWLNQRNRKNAESQAGAKAGTEKGGPLLGDKTRLPVVRNQQELSGTPGEGPEEVETTRAAEGPGQPAHRPTRENYQKYRRLSEAALDSEPIPLGQRETIRRYFEMIRPDGGEAKEGPGPQGSR
jgi:hypothetical protein